MIQDLLDLFKRKSDKKGHVGEPDDDDDDDTAPVDEVKWDQYENLVKRGYENHSLVNKTKAFFCFTFNKKIS